MELAIAAFAAVVALVSLIWQAHEWRGSSARPDVEGLVFRDADGRATLQVEVRNKGRGPCQLVHIEMRAVAGGTGFDPTKYALDAGSVALPKQIEGGHLSLHRFDASRISRALAGHGETVWDARLVAHFGDGTTRESRGHVRLGVSLVTAQTPEVEHGKVREITEVVSSTVSRRGRLGRSLRSRLRL